MKKGDLIELDVSSYAFEGKGVARIIKEINYEGEEPKKFVVFVEGSYPGDKVIAQIGKVRKSYAEARVKDFIYRSPMRVEPKCRYFGVCGGCKQQDLDYKDQLRFKEEQVKEIFERLGGFENSYLLPIVPSESIFFYRNKMEYSFARKRWLSGSEIESMQQIEDKDFALGLHIPGMYDKVLDIKECFLQSEISNGILNFTRDFFKSRGVSIYSTQTHEGYLRNLIIRSSFHTNDLMVNLVTSLENDQLINSYRDALLAAFPAITTLINNISSKKSQVATGDYEIVLYGPGYIIDKIGEYQFRISANSFFQTNTRQAEDLYNVAAEFARFDGSEIVYDLYSGAGTIPIYISSHVKKIYGFESVAPAVDDARVNIGLNKIENFEPLLCDLNKSFLPLLRQRGIPPPDLIIADPPRSGMNPRTIDDILNLKPGKIVYISCNPATQARDLKLICAGGYILKQLRPVDMFPHTYHIENVALLEKS